MKFKSIHASPHIYVGLGSRKDTAGSARDQSSTRTHRSAGVWLAYASCMDEGASTGRFCPRCNREEVLSLQITRPYHSAGHWNTGLVPQVHTRFACRAASEHCGGGGRGSHSILTTGMFATMNLRIAHIVSGGYYMRESTGYAQSMPGSS